MTGKSRPSVKLFHSYSTYVGLISSPDLLGEKWVNEEQRHDTACDWRSKVQTDAK